MKILVVLISLLIAAIGILGVVAPAMPVQFAQSLLSPGALYIVAAVRISFGLLLVWVASGSRAPVVLRVLGVLIVVGGVITLFIGVEFVRDVLDWWTSQGDLFRRMVMGIPVIFGFFIVYAVTYRRRAAV